MTDKERIVKIVLTLSFLCAVTVIAGINRKIPPEFLQQIIFEPVRISESLAMLVFTPLAVIGLWILFRLYDGTKSLVMTIIFLFGIYFLGTGFGMHMPTNSMHIYYQDKMSAEMMERIIFFDDQLGHWLFFVGFAFISIGGIGAELNLPFKEKLPQKVMIVAYVIGFLVAATIFKNMIKEKTVVDIAVLIVTIVCAASIHVYKGFVSLKRLPAMTILYIGYGGGTLATILYWLIYDLKG